MPKLRVIGFSKFTDDAPGKNITPFGNMARDSLGLPAYNMRPPMSISNKKVPDTDMKMQRGVSHLIPFGPHDDHKLLLKKLKLGFYSMDSDKIGVKGRKPVLSPNSKIPKCPIRKCSPTERIRQFDCGAFNKPRVAASVLLELTIPEDQEEVQRKSLATIRKSKAAVGKPRTDIKKTTGLKKNTKVSAPKIEAKPTYIYDEYSYNFEDEDDSSSNDACAQTTSSYLRTTRKFTIYSQTDPDIGLITGVGNTNVYTNTPVPINREYPYFFKASLKTNKITRMVSKAVQTCSSELFNFDEAVLPIVQKLASSIFEQAMIEWEHEEDMSDLYLQTEEYKFRVHRQELNLAILMAREQRLVAQRTKLIEEAVRDSKLNAKTEECIKAVSFAHSYLLKLSTNTIQYFRKQKSFYEDKSAEVEVVKNLIPWIDKAVTNKDLTVPTALLDDIIRYTVQKRENEETIGRYEQIRTQHFNAMIRFHQQSRSLETETLFGEHNLGIEELGERRKSNGSITGLQKSTTKFGPYDNDAPLPSDGILYPED